MPKTAATHYHAQLGLSNKGNSIKDGWLSIFDGILVPWDLL